MQGSLDSRITSRAPPTNGDLESLVRAMAGGDAGALSCIYEQTVGQVFGIARCMLRSKEDAEEIVCDVYTHAWQTASHYDPTRGSVMAWLAIMARNRSVDRLRQRRKYLPLTDAARHPDDGGAGGAASPEEILARFQTGSAVHRALETLPPERRRLIALAFFNGLSHQEIADSTGIPLGTVKSHVRRALSVLQAALTRQRI
jgi:RNA polymerase sigma-70 factor (ECF subfamily)